MKKTDEIRTVSGIPKEWTIESFFTPGIGIRLKKQKDPAKNGRFIVPANHAKKNGSQNEFRAHLLLSDDFGETGPELNQYREIKCIAFSFEELSRLWEQA